MFSLFPYLNSSEAWIMFIEGIAILTVMGALMYMAFSYMFKHPIKLIFYITDCMLGIFATVCAFNFFLM